MDSKKTLRRFQKQTSFLVYDHTSMLLNLMVDVLGITPVTQGYHQSSWDWWWARWIFWSVPLYHPYLNDVFSQRVPSGKERKHCGKSPYYGMLWVNPLFLCAIFNSKLLVYQRVTNKGGFLKYPKAGGTIPQITPEVSKLKILVEWLG